MGPEIVYVSGRQRAEGEMNGKSANLNNCLSHLYPGGCRIPGSEVVCIFDADQARCRAALLRRVIIRGCPGVYLEQLRCMRACMQSADSNAIMELRRWPTWTSS